MDERGVWKGTAGAFDLFLFFFLFFDDTETTGRWRKKSSYRLLLTGSILFLEETSEVGSLFVSSQRLSFF